MLQTLIDSVPLEVGAAAIASTGFAVGLAMAFIAWGLGSRRVYHAEFAARLINKECDELRQHSHRMEQQLADRDFFHSPNEN